MQAVEAGAIALDDRVADHLAGVARRRSRVRHHRGSSRARVRADRVSPLLPRSSGTRRVRARDLHAAARVRAAHAVDLQRSRIHPAGVHPRGRESRAVREEFDELRDGSSPAGRKICSSIRRASCASAARRPSSISGADGCCRERSTTRTAGRSAASRDTPGCSAPRRALATSRGDVLEADCRGAEAGRSREPETFARFARKSTVPGSSRALGWDTMLPTSSCGTRLSPRAIGHTGFTGTSLWIDPEAGSLRGVPDQPRASARDNNRIQPVRRALHDAVVGRSAVSS